MMQLLHKLGLCCTVGVVCIASTQIGWGADTLRLSLHDAIEMAFRKNFDIQSARQDSLMAHVVGSSGITGYLPKVSLQAGINTGANNIDQSFADGRVIAKDGASVDGSSAAATVTWTVFDGFRMFASANRYKALEQQGLSRVQATMQSVLADVITAYSNVVATQSFMATVDSALALAKEQMQIEELRHAVGASSGVDLAQSRIDFNAQQAMVVQMRSTLQNATSALLTLLNTDPQTVIVADTSMPTMKILSRDDLVESVRQSNPELLALQKALEAASAHVAEVQSVFMPTITLTGTYQYNKTTQGAGFILTSNTTGWNIGAQLTWNIFNGFSDKIAREQALVQEEKSRIDIKALQNSIIGRIDRTYRSYQTMTELYRIYRESYDDALKNANVALQSLRVGTVSALQVRQALLSVLQTGEQLTQTTYQKQLAATELLRLTGTLIR